MNAHASRLLGTALLALLGVACATDDVPVKRLAQPDCLAELCDWIARQYGGYSSHVRCPDGGQVRTYLSRAECLERLPLSVNIVVANSASVCNDDVREQIRTCVTAKAALRCSSGVPSECQNLNGPGAAGP